MPKANTADNATINIAVSAATNLQKIEFPNMLILHEFL